MQYSNEEGLRHFRFLANQTKHRPVSAAALTMLLELNIPTNHAGFDYLLRSVEVCYQHSLWSMCQIYEAVAASYSYPVSNETVEQAVRSAIRKAWKNKNPFVWKYYFSQDLDGIIKKPTNSEFISRIARVLQLCQELQEEVGYEQTK